MRRIIIYAVLVASLFTGSRVCMAGVLDIISHARTWWLSRSVEADTSGPGSESPVTPPPETPTPPTGRQPGMCAVPREPERITCQVGSGFLCVQTPPGSVAGDSLRIKGTIDRENSRLASIRIALQNEYTNRMTVVDTSNPASGDCWSDSLPDGAFCLAQDGKFSARIDLRSPGPYTIYVSATRLSGSSEERRVRISRVVALSLDPSRVELRPDVRTTPNTSETHVSVRVKLLDESCQFCDFIGASTGGVRVTVTNTIRDSRGNTQNISCETQVEQGGQGQFILGVPVLAGTNTISISACNSATGACPTVGGISFEGRGSPSSSGLNIISPPPEPAYDSGEYPTINWQFRQDDSNQCVDVQFNREAVRQVCKDQQGFFVTELSPKVGINVATVAVTGQRPGTAWTFGWGRILSPYANERGTIDVPQAAQIAIPAATVSNIVLPLANNFLRSDEFQRVLDDLSGAGQEPSPPSQNTEEISIPGCEAASEGALQIELNGRPQVGAARFEGLNFGQGKIDLSAVLDDVRVDVDLITPVGRDPLPLVIAFHRAIVDLSLKSEMAGDGRPLILVSSPHDDCAYKNGTYCRHAPAPLIPARFAGAATNWGGYVACDVERAAEDAREACRALNSINAQTAIVGEQVIDAINSAIYCGGSRWLTQIARGNETRNFHLGCRENETCSNDIMRALPNVDIPLGLRLEGNPQVSNMGILLSAALISGNSSLYTQTPQIYRVLSAGAIVAASGGGRVIGSVSDAMGDVDVAASLDAINAVLFSAVSQGDGVSSRGLLDIDLHEPFFNSNEFDFVRKCDEFVADPSHPEIVMDKLCLVRPRLGEITGSVLTNYGYFREHGVMQPLMIAISGNKALSPRLSVVSLSDIPIVPRPAVAGESQGDQNPEQNFDQPSGSFLGLELGGVGLSLYALEVDEAVPPDRFGNLTIRRDSLGQPIIHSMRPSDPDPTNGQIAGYDLTLLLGIELSDLTVDEERFLIRVRLMAERSRLVIVPVAGGNATTVPPMSIIATLYEYLNVTLAEKSQRDNAFEFEIPKEVPSEAGEDEMLFASIGLKSISFGDDGISLDFDPTLNSIRAALKGLLTQLLHEGGSEIRRTLP